MRAIKIQNLDFTDNYIIIKNYEVDSDANVCIINYNGKIVSEYYKEITALDNGFVVKKPNGKNVYLNTSLYQVTNEYDIIYTCRANDGILVVANLNENIENKENPYGLEEINYDIVNINNGQVIAESFEYINGMRNEKHEIDYYDDASYNEYKETICSVDSYYLNTALYEKYYGNN